MNRLLPTCLLLLTACAGGGGLRGTPLLYAQSLDSVSSSCRHWPGLCEQAVGEPTAASTAGSGSAELSASLVGAAKVYTEYQKGRVEQALTRCATEAQTQVFLQHTAGKRPTPEECREEGMFGGRWRTRARFLGEEAHKLAFSCIAAELNSLRPGGFSLEPRYRSNPQTGQLEWIAPEQEEALLEEGCYEDLRGTIKPDIVIHAGDPLRPQAVYDLKFPCVRSTSASWCEYLHGPHKGSSQRDVYQELLRIPPHQILPWIGVVP